MTRRTLSELAEFRATMYDLVWELDHPGVEFNPIVTKKDLCRLLDILINQDPDD